MRYTGWFVLIDKNEKFNVRQVDFLEAASNLEPPCVRKAAREEHEHMYNHKNAVDQLLCMAHLFLAMYQ